MPVVSGRARAVVALLVGVGVGMLAAYSMHTTSMPDFLPILEGSRVWASGANPYTAHYPDWEGYFYPFPVTLLLWPLTALSLPVAGGIFMGLSGAWLAWALTRTSWAPLLLCLSAPTFAAIRLGHFAPLLMAAALSGAAMGLVCLKPTLGIALFAAWPRRLAVIVAAAVLGVSLLVWPGWPNAWFEATRAVVHHPVPVTLPGGVITLLALARWRVPEARLLVVMACVPQVMLFADQLPLLLTARTERERLLSITLGWVTLTAALLTLKGLIYQQAWRNCSAAGHGVVSMLRREDVA